MDRVLQTAVTSNTVPFAIGMTANRAGVTYAGAAGDAAPGRPAMVEDTVFRIFSMTKAIGSVAATILIDRGQLSLDTPVAKVLPEWDTLPVLDGWDGGKPILRRPETTATIRHLLTHTSGLEYEMWNGDMKTYLEVTGNPPSLSGSRLALHYPLMSDPGTRWAYGISIDWLGMVIEAVDGRPIDAFCQEEIFDPLGMQDTTFEAEGVEDRICHAATYGEDGSFTPVDIRSPPHPEVYGMGHCLYATAPDYLRFLRMILCGGTLDGTEILSSDAWRSLMQDQLDGLKTRKMVSVAPQITCDFDPFPDIDTTHTLAFLRNEADVPGRRQAGSVSWAGMMNTHFWIDPASDLCAVIMTQTLPFAAPRFMTMYESFERAVYESR